MLTAAEAKAILDACEHPCDRFLFAMLHDSGIRIGESLGLRHDNIAAAERELTVRPRLNDNGVRTKSATTRTIPWSSAAGWSTWFSLGGQARSAPAVAVYGNQLQLVVRGTTGALYQLFGDSAGWHGWNLLGGSWWSGAGMTQFTDTENMFHIYIRGTNNAISEHVYSPTYGWWTSSIGGATYTDPEAVRFQNRIQVLVRGTDGVLYKRSYHLSSAHGEYVWDSWTSAGSSAIASAPGATATGSYLHVFARASNGHVLWRTYNGSTWSGYADLGGVTI